MPENTSTPSTPTAGASPAAAASPAPSTPANNTPGTVTVTPPAGSAPTETPTVLGAQYNPQTPLTGPVKTPEQLAAEKATRQANMTPEQKAADDANEAATARLKSIPADGKYDIKLPEGTQLPAEFLEGLQKTFHEAGMTQENAQKIITQTAPIIAQAEKAAAEKQVADIMAYRDSAEKENIAALKADPEIGGNKFTESCAIAQKALRAFGSETLLKKLEDTRLGSDPDFFKLCYNVGQKISEAGVTQATPDSGSQQSLSQRWFGSEVARLEKQAQGT